MRVGAVCIIVLLLAPVPLLAVDSAPPPLKWQSVFRELSSGTFAERNEAEAEILAQGEQAIPWLMYVIERGDTEGVARSVLLLDRMLVSPADDLAQAAEDALYALIDGGRPYAARSAKQVIESHATLLERKGKAALTKLGAKIDQGPDLLAMSMQYNIDSESPDWNSDGRNAVMERIFAGYNSEEERQTLPSRPEQIFITSRWKGGEDGIRHLRRFRSAGRIGIIVTKGSNIPTEAIYRETARLPEVSVTERGPSLGVRGSTFSGAQIVGVLPGGAAEQAGLVPGDLITSINGSDIEYFEDLIQDVKQRQVGDSIKMTLLRDGVEHELTAQLKDWGDTQTSDGLWDPSARYELRQPIMPRFPDNPGWNPR